MTLILSFTIPKAEKELCFIMFTVFFHDFLPIACFRNLYCLFQLSFCAHLCCTFLDDLSISCRRIHISNCPTPKQLPYFIRIVSEYSPNWSGLPHCLPISFAFLFLHFLVSLSWDHFPNKLLTLLTLVFLSQGLHLREPRWIRHSVNSYGMNEKVIFHLLLHRQRSHARVGVGFPRLWGRRLNSNAAPQ